MELLRFFCVAKNEQKNEQKKLPKSDRQSPQSSSPFCVGVTKKIPLAKQGGEQVLKFVLKMC